MDLRDMKQSHRTVPRHTFGTPAVALDMPIDVVQRILDLASRQTTSI
ncbi:hypothetical protein [Burkholderia sp. PAMC 26561]|nr:hypothetical protein [Burkholderia sp. PAMC 26561]